MIDDVDEVKVIVESDELDESEVIEVIDEI